jgi:hypothetical protein
MSKQLTRRELLEKELEHHLQECINCYIPLIEEPYYCDEYHRLEEDLQKEGT